MHQYKEFLKKQNERIPRKSDRIASGFLCGRQLPEDMFIEFAGFTERIGISQKTAQARRDNNVISYSQIGNKIFYQVPDIQQLLLQNYFKARKEAAK